jgi:phosphate transport system substrate-binding protein
VIDGGCRMRQKLDKKHNGKGGNSHEKGIHRFDRCGLADRRERHGNDAAARDYISIVGSSTVYPFATVVAEQFGKTTKFNTPKIESTGSGGGLKLFCAGVGVEHPDITNASRRIKVSECVMCQKNGVEDIIEVKIGYDGIVLANSKKTAPFKADARDIFLALAKDVPDSHGFEKLVPNPHKTWKDVNPALPATKIEVLGPPPTSGTRDAFVELAMEGGRQKLQMDQGHEEEGQKEVQGRLSHHSGRRRLCGSR